MLESWNCLASGIEVILSKENPLNVQTCSFPENENHTIEMNEDFESIFSIVVKLPPHAGMYQLTFKQTLGCSHCICVAALL